MDLGDRCGRASKLAFVYLISMFCGCGTLYRSS